MMTNTLNFKLKETTEKIAANLEWIAEVLHGENLIKKLIFFGLVIFSVFNPKIFSKIYKFFIGTNLPKNYTLFFGIVVLSIFIFAFFLALRKRPSRYLPEFEPKPSAIKGLLPFGFDDAEIFNKLQRENELHECLNSLIDRNFRLGILLGESGCGKTSFLQAGIWAMLPKRSESHCSVYVKFTDIDPHEAIRQAIQEQIQLSDLDITEKDFLNLIKKASDIQNKHLILLLDQFEQFYIHKTIDEQKDFNKTLKTLYHNYEKFRVKILISIRSDFGQIFELLNSIDVILKPQHIFSLKNLTQLQASKIFEVIAKETAIKYDLSFVENLTTYELADKNNGLISPVDIQILIWIIYSFKSYEEPEFNKTFYQKKGGIEGILKMFLSRALDPLKEQKQVAIQILRALIDMRKNVRAGVFTLKEIQQKLSNTISENKIEEICNYLASSNVRLITAFFKHNTTIGYELAHERLIPIIRQKVNEELTNVDKTNQFFEQRVYEWLGNNNSKRYLLTWKELRLIDKYKASLSFFKNKRQKEELIKLSKIRISRIRRFVFSFLLLLCVLLIWRQSPWGQIYLIKKDLVNLSNKITNKSLLGEVAISFAYVGDLKNAILIANKIQDDFQREYAKKSIAILAAKIGIAKHNISFVYKSLDIADSSLKICDFKKSVMKTIYEASEEMGNWELSRDMQREMSNIDITTAEQEIQQNRNLWTRDENFFSKFLQLINEDETYAQAFAFDWSTFENPTDALNMVLDKINIDKIYGLDRFSICDIRDDFDIFMLKIFAELAVEMGHKKKTIAALDLLLPVAKSIDLEDYQQFPENDL